MIKRLFFTVFAALSIGVLKTKAQDNIVLTVGLPPYMSTLYDEAFFDPFRAEHPGVDVIIVSLDETTSFPPPVTTSSIENHLNGISQYVASADVLSVDPFYSITHEATKAGYYLDLASLVAADPDLSEDAFYPPAWRAFRWDNGMWALPNTFEPQILVYDPKAFDEAGLTYPDEHWTIDNFATASRALTKRDAQGNPTSPGCFCDITPLLYSAVNGSLIDENGNLNFDQPALANVVETWGNVLNEIIPQGGYGSEGVGLQTTGLGILGQYSRIALLPAPNLPGFPYAYVTGYGISAGTVNPALAFELVKFLAQNPRNYSDTGVYPGLRTATLSAALPGGGLSNLSAENQQIVDNALENAYAGSDLLYFDYIQAAITDTRQNGTDVHIALQKAQHDATVNLETASNWTGAQSIVINEPTPPPPLNEGEIVLHFGISQNQVTNPSDWTRIAQEFAADDPQVGQVDIEYQGMDYQAFMDNNDCYFLNYDAVDPGRIADYVNLDPYSSADPDFIPEDFVPGALDALKFDGKIWGYPLSLYPVVLVYDPKTFEKAGIPIPGTSWTANEFSDAVQALQNADLGIAVFSPRYAENADWLMLIAAYGGLPIDYRTDPPTINFTDATTIEAIRQVLDMAKSGAIHYSKLGTFNYTEMSGPGAISATELNGYVDFLKEFDSVNFPQNSAYQTMGLGQVGGLYISKHAPNPDACYRWIAKVAASPELVGGVMPARMSIINDPALLAAQGENAVAMYQELAKLLASPQTIIFHSGFGGGGIYSLEMFFVNQWLNRAFDKYVLEDGDLEAALTDAQNKVDAFITCTTQEAAVSDGSTDADLNAHYEAVASCMKLVDPDMAAEQEALSQGG